MTTTSDISPEAIKELRARTGAGFMDCKRALQEAGGDLEAAVQLLRERNQASAEKRAGREAREGVIASYIHVGGRFGSLIEVNCETDFVARNEQFQGLVRDLARQVVALGAQYPTIEAIPVEVLEAKRAALLAEPSVQAKPERLRGQIVDGQLRKWFQEIVLYEQPFQDTERTVGELIRDAIGTIGENIKVRRFTRYELGEEL